MVKEMSIVMITIANKGYGIFIIPGNSWKHDRIRPTCLVTGLSTWCWVGLVIQYQDSEPGVYDTMGDLVVWVVVWVVVWAVVVVVCLRVCVLCAEQVLA